MCLDTKLVVLKTIYAVAIQVTPENMVDTADWCKGEIQKEKVFQTTTTWIETEYVNTKLPVGKYKAYVGDWILCFEDRTEVYTNDDYKKKFDELGR